MKRTGFQVHLYMICYIFAVLIKCYVYSLEICLSCIYSYNSLSPICSQPVSFTAHQLKILFTARYCVMSNVLIMPSECNQSTG